MRKRSASTLRYATSDIIAVYAKCDGICGLCGQPVTDANASIDHIVPVRHGGQHHIDNWQLMHRNCNAKKHDRMPTEIPAHALTNPFIRQAQIEMEELRVRCGRMVRANVALLAENERLEQRIAQLTNAYQQLKSDYNELVERDIDRIQNNVAAARLTAAAIRNQSRRRRTA